MWSSPSERARETAALLGLAAEIEPCPALAERDWGSWFEGADGDAVGERRALARRQASADPWGWRPEGGESLREVRDRVGGWIDTALAGLRDGALVAVSHGEAILAARMTLEPSWRASPLALPSGADHTLPNGGVLVYEFETGSVIPTHRRLMADPLAAAAGRSGLSRERLAGSGD